jgi:hypothetical protein
VRVCASVCGVLGSLVVQLAAVDSALAAEAPQPSEAKTEQSAEARTRLWPFYEYRADQNELRVLTLTSSLPAAAVRRPDYTRVLNVSWFQGNDELGTGHFVAPLYLRVQKERAGGLFTLFGGYVHSDDLDLFGVLGPVYWRYRSEGATTQGVLWPALLHTRAPESSDTRLLLGLAGQEQSTAAGDARSSLWLWPLFAWERDARGAELDTLLVDYRRRNETRRLSISPLGLVSLLSYRGDVDEQQWSFLAGIVDWRYDRQAYTLRLLGLPLLDCSASPVQ